jgi:hypothetical protein
MRRMLWAWMLAAGASSVGCQCCQLTESLGDVVDAITVTEWAADPWYHPGLDLTRIGRRDWCECGINSWLCPCRCDTKCPPGTCP